MVSAVPAGEVRAGRIVPAREEDGHRRVAFEHDEAVALRVDAEQVQRLHRAGGVVEHSARPVGGGERSGVARGLEHEVVQHLVVERVPRRPIDTRLGRRPDEVAIEISLLMQSNLEQLGFVVTQQADPWNRITEIAGKVAARGLDDRMFRALMDEIS